MSHDANLKHQLKQLKYKHVDIAVRDVSPVLSSYQSLTIQKEQSVLPLTSGSKEYVVIKGTIPVLYRGASYNIPICMFLLETHPYNPPVVFVRPTADMVVAESRHVDKQGRVYLPYLAEWKHPSSDLSGLVQIMAIIFADTMPVYSRPGGAPQPQIQPANAWQNQQQAPTPYPPNSHTPFYPSQPQQNQSSAYPVVSNGAVSSQSSNLPYPVGPPTSHPAPPPVSQWPPPATSSNSASQISQDEIKASLIWAVEDKLKRKFRDDHEQFSTELASLRQTNTELVSGKKQISNILETIETEKRDVETRRQAIEERKKEVEASLSRLRSASMPSVDDIVSVPYPLYRQLFEAHAEEIAIDDAIYQLGVALGKNKISVEVYLKKVRELSSRQFMLRALVDKCRKVAGLPAITASCPSH